MVDGIAMSNSETYSSDAFNSLPFRDKLDHLYTVPGKEKRDLIVGSPEARRLVRSFAVESLFYTIKEIGLEDSGDLLALASGEQVRGFLDLDCWKKDRLETESALAWLEALVEGGSMALGEFLDAVDLGFLVLLLKRFIRVYRRDDPEEPDEDSEGGEVFELDEHYPIVFHRWDARAPLIRRLLEELYERDYGYFVTVMEEIWWGVETELEEASFQVRNSRLQDRGFPDYYEALEIYKPLRVRDLPERATPFDRERDPEDYDGIPLERSLLIPDGAQSFLSEVLSDAFHFEGADELRREVALLSNRVMVAEGVETADRDAVASAVALAHDTVNLGLEHLSDRDRVRALDLVRRHHLQHVFRIGWALLLELRRSAKTTEEALGIPAAGGEIGFLDSPYREALSGFGRPKPRFFRGLEEPGELQFRPFRSLDDLTRANQVLAEIAGLPDLARRFLGQSLAQLAKLRPSDADEFRASAALLTAFANLILGRGASVAPIPRRDLPELRAKTRDEKRPKLRAKARASALERAGGESAFLSAILARFEEEFLSLAEDEPVDPRFVTCLMIATPASRRNA